jgi:hypothetical protein
MIPLRDNLHTKGAPPVALLITTALLVAGLIVPGAGAGPAILAAIGAYLYGPSIVRDLGPLGAIATATVGAGAAGMLAHLAGAKVGGWSIVGAAAALVLVHLARHPRARMLSLIALPYRTGLTEVPSVAVASVWALLAVLLTAGA